ncbi:DNA mismatch repair protein-like protein MutS [Calycina marina]|uniref:DNA mismatch repair protein-like protein MutS n=1 Tax=Calycina marina TaxID=1763456 RepID=A0A9P7ZAE2_9HELO|nr:DNA mismatch repair protein-like protein MutS [Calycina marina]
MATLRPSTSYSTNSRATSGFISTSYRPGTSRPGTARPSTRSRLRAGSVIGGESQKIICAISEGRGVTPTVGLAFVNITTGEAVLSQICDNQFYAKTLNKLLVFDPSEILIVSTAGPPNPKSKMFQIVEDNIIGAKMVVVDRKYWSEHAGLDYIQQLAFVEDVEAIKVAIGGNYFATCCFSAALKYIDLTYSLTFAFHSLRIKYQPSEGSMMIDLSTIRSLELIQNIQEAKSKNCLFGLMNETITPMGSRLLRSTILQPSTQPDVLKLRYESLDELTKNGDTYLQIRQALKAFTDIEKLLTSLIIIPTKSDIRLTEQSINNILMLKSFVNAVNPLHEALAGAESDLLIQIRSLCRPELVESTIKLISDMINDDVAFCKTPLELRTQRTYAVRSGVNGLLDVARQTFKEATEDVYQHIKSINQEHGIKADTKFDNSRRYYLRVAQGDFDKLPMSDILINKIYKKGWIECQTLDLMKLNQRLEDSHQEVVLMSDETAQTLLDEIRGEIPSLFRVCESIAMLDMIAGFGQLVTSCEDDYTQPEITDCIAIKSGRHPVREKVHKAKFVPNDVYASDQTRFQIITGCNMSGKSTYIRSIALMSVMAQVGCFVPASYASFPMIHQLFARVSMDDSIEAKMSTFAAEMRETAFILRNIDKHSLAIVDELGRGTSTRDGLAIAIAIAEALVDSKALIWFVTHFRELAHIMSQRTGVVNLHLQVDMSVDSTMTMLYKIGEGYVQEEHYGIALARVANLPPTAIEVAEEVSSTLIAQAEAKNKSSKALALTKRRKLVLSLKEALKQAQSSPMEGKALLSWLRKLQEEFVHRMEQIERDVADGERDSVEIEEDEEDEKGSQVIEGEMESNA